MKDISPEDDVVPSRPLREAVIETVAMSGLGVFTVLFVCAFPALNDNTYRIFDVAAVFGERLLDHIGWAFGVYVPTLLGFYAIVIGGQLVVAPAVEARTRRTLGFTAEAMAGALVPALAAIFAACITDPSQAGALLVIVPVTVVVFFLAIQLGRFIVLEPALRLASAQRARTSAKESLTALRRRSRRPVWLVVAVHTLTGSAVGTLATLVFVGPNGLSWAPAISSALFSLALGSLGVHGVYTYRTAQDRISKVLAWVVPAGFYVVMLLVIIVVTFEYGLAPGAVVLLVALFSVVSTLWPRKRAGRFLLNWTIQGAATGYAARSLAKTYVRSIHEIRELRRTSDGEKQKTLIDRIIDALHALQGTGPASGAYQRRRRARSWPRPGIDSSAVR